MQFEATVGEAVGHQASSFSFVEIAFLFQLKSLKGSNGSQRKTFFGPLDIRL